MPRMQILSPAEQRAFDTPPLMNAAQRKAAFDLPVGFQREAEQLRDPVHQIGFCLNAGYFRQSRRCFAPEKFHDNDIAYVATRLANHTDLSQLFQRLEPVIEILSWDQNSSRSYALAVMKSDPHDLRRRKAADRRLHLIAFVAHQYYALQDNLVATLLSSVKAAENAATREFKDWCYAERKSQATKLKARIQAFEIHFQSAMATLRGAAHEISYSRCRKISRWPNPATG